MENIQMPVKYLKNISEYLSRPESELADEHLPKEKKKILLQISAQAKEN
jgi:hypothetical protein